MSRIPAFGMDIREIYEKEELEKKASENLELLILGLEKDDKDSKEMVVKILKLFRNNLLLCIAEQNYNWPPLDRISNSGFTKVDVAAYAPFWLIFSYRIFKIMDGNRKLGEALRKSVEDINNGLIKE